MNNLATLLIKIQGDSTELSSALTQATAKVQAFGQKMTDIGSSMSTQLTLPIVAMGGAMVKAFTVQEDAVAKLTGALRANGGQAGVTAKEIQDMASSLQKVTKFGDEVTISASSLLLTFHQIRNEVGAGNDVFNRTVKASQDLATVMDTDLRSATMQLAKALENPKIGLSALTRSGTTFTEQQKAMIGALVDSGNQLKAQTMILDVVEKQYKGLAEELRKTTSGTIKGAFNELGDEMEVFGGIIAKSLVPFVNRMTDVVRGVAGVDESVKKMIVVMGGIIAIAGPAVLALGLITKGVVAMGLAFTTSTGPIGMLITAVGLLTGAYILHNLTVTKAESEMRAFVTMNREYAKTLTRNAEEMQAFASASGRTAREIAEVQRAFKDMTESTKARALSLAESLDTAKKELQGLLTLKETKGFIGTIKEERITVLTSEVKSLESALIPLYDFLTKAGKGLGEFSKATATVSPVVSKAVGSIAQLAEELSVLQTQFEETASGAERSALAVKIIDLEDRISSLRSVLTPVKKDLSFLNDLLREDLPTGNIVSSAGDLLVLPTRLEQVNVALREYARLLETADTQVARQNIQAMITSLEQLRDEFMGIKEKVKPVVVEITAEMAIANQMATQFTDSFGAGLANVVVQGEKLADVLKNIGKLVLSSAIQTAITLLLRGTSAFGVTGAGATFGLIGNLFGASQSMAGVGALAPASASLNMGGSFKLQGTDLVLAINRSERQFR